MASRYDLSSEEGFFPSVPCRFLASVACRSVRSWTLLSSLEIWLELVEHCVGRLFIVDFMAS